MKYLYLSFSFLLFACGNSNNKQETTTTTPSEKETHTHDQQATPEPISNEPLAYFNANGNDWTLELKSAIDGTYPLILIQNNKKDTLHASLSKDMAAATTKPVKGQSTTRFIGKFQSTDKEETVELDIFPGECSSKSGEKTNFSCKLTAGKKLLNGCGNYSED